MQAPFEAQGRVRVRSFTRADLPAILAIERDSHPNGWSRRELLGFLRGRDVLTRVLTLDGRPRAFFMLQMDSAAVRLINLAVHPDARRRGLARRALREVDSIALDFSAGHVELEVRESNLAAHLLYRQAGYRAYQIARGMYGDEDGYRMRKRALRSAEEVVPRLFGQLPEVGL